MGTHPIFESDFDCLTESLLSCTNKKMLSRSACSALTRAASVKTVTMIPGDGVGPDLMNSLKDVFKAAKVPVEFEELGFSEIQKRDDSDMLAQVVESIERNGIGIMGAILTSEAEGTGSGTGAAFRLRK